MIKVELLAQEARRRGLDKDPKTRARIRQILRDELLRAARAELPSPDQIPVKEVRAHYQTHKDEYKDPERRRVAHIVMASKPAATKVLKEALSATPQQWGKLVAKHSLDTGGGHSPNTPLELAGDLGIVSAPGSKKGTNHRVPTALRKAVFRIEKMGGVLPSLVDHSGRFHIVRLTGKTPERRRSFAEAERTIRVSLVQRKLESLEKRLEKELRGRYKVTIDEGNLAKVKVPSQKPKNDKPAPKKP